jgi:hypothetical protein
MSDENGRAGAGYHIKQNMENDDRPRYAGISSQIRRWNLGGNRKKA